MFLENPRVLKVGRNVAFDLQCLAESFNMPGRFVGGVDIAKVAKEKGVASDARIGLADLCAKVLHHRLEKDNSIRVCTEWTFTELSEEQIQYVALDVWASLQIYLSLQEMTVPTPVDFKSVPPPDLGTEIFIYQEDKSRIVARGSLSPLGYRTLDGISITATRILIDIKEVYIPGAVITTHHGRPLSSFGDIPFSVICRKTQVYTFVESFIPVSVATPQSPPVSEDRSPEDLLAPLKEAEMTVNEDHSLASLDIGFGQPDLSAIQETEMDPKNSDRCRTSEEECNKILQDLHSRNWPSDIRSRILKDIFHVFHMIYISKSHGLRVTFSRALRDTIFLPDPEDKRRIESYLSRQMPPVTWDECLLGKSTGNPRMISAQSTSVPSTYLTLM